MLFAGFQVAQGNMTLWEATAAGAAGNLLGSWLAYWAGKYGGRVAIEHYGKYILLSQKKLDIAEKWWDKYGDPAVFFSRLLPIVRTFISLPAGIARMRLSHFSAYTLAGSIPWSLMLAFIGVKVGENWESIYEKLHLLDYPVLGGIVLVIAYALWRRRHGRRQRLSQGGSSQESPPPEGLPQEDFSQKASSQGGGSASPLPEKD